VHRPPHRAALILHRHHIVQNRSRTGNRKFYGTLDNIEEDRRGSETFGEAIDKPLLRTDSPEMTKYLIYTENVQLNFHNVLPSIFIILQ
jgi:hypothetical protein